MVSLEEQMLSLSKQLKEARTPHEQTALKRQIEAPDEHIDALIYELYGLTEEEILIVEGRQIAKSHCQEQLATFVQRASGRWARPAREIFFEL